MTNYELYIDGQLCDLSTDTSVTLVYQSGLFKPLDAIQSNRSYNIDLPMTSRNIGIFKFASMPNVDSDAPYVKIKAALHKGGVPIFDNGFAVITGISDVISVTLTWGNVNNFDPLFDSPMSALSDTLYEMGIGSIPWNNNSKVMTTTSDESGKGMGFYAIDYGMGLQKPQYVHPAIRVDRVLEAIEKYQGIEINGAPLRGDWEYHHVVPCLSLNGDAKSAETETINLSGFGAKDVNGYYVLSVDYENRYSIFIKNGYKFDVKGATNIDIMVLIKINYRVPYDTPPYIADAEDISTPLKYCRKFTDEFTVFIRNEEDLPKSGNLVIVLAPSGIISTLESVNGLRNLYIKATPREKVHFPSVYPIGVNLPDMSQGEFLQSLMILNGLFAYVDNKNPNTINLMSVYDIMRAKEEDIFVDWSNKVLLNDKRIISIPDASEFIIEDYAQKNILDYDNDDDVQTKTEGTILIKNVNLEKETELTDMEFSASENIDYGDGRIAYIPIYKKQDNSGNADYNELKPRILENMAVAEDGTEYYAGYFPDLLRFGGSDGIVATKYAELQEILERLRIITVRAKLSVIDLYNLDYKKPIYISQFGRFYAIYSIETGENDICECKLVQLPTRPAYVGENLLKNTRGFSEGWMGTGILQYGKYQGLSVYYQTGVDITDRYQDIRYQNTLLLPDTSYTLSFYAKGSGSLVTYVFPNALGQIIMTNGYPEWIGTKQQTVIANTIFRRNGNDILSLSGQRMTQHCFLQTGQAKPYCSEYSKALTRPISAVQSSKKGPSQQTGLQTQTIKQLITLACDGTCQNLKNERLWHKTLLTKS